MKADDIVEALVVRHNHSGKKEWACIRELRLGTAHGSVEEKRIDLFVINCWPYKGNHKIAYEVKVSRPDFLREKKRPWKRHPVLTICNQFYFAAPKGLIKPGEVPRDVGLVEVDEDGNVTVVVEAPDREAYPPTWSLVASIGRRLDHQEGETEKLRGVIEDLGEQLRKKEKWIQDFKQRKLFEEPV